MLKGIEARLGRWRGGVLPVALVAGAGCRGVEKSLCGFQIGRVEPLGEPVADWVEERQSDAETLGRAGQMVAIDRDADGWLLGFRRHPTELSLITSGDCHRAGRARGERNRLLPAGRITSPEQAGVA